MPFGSSVEWNRNPGLDPALDALTGAQDRVRHTKSAGNRWWRSILRGAMQGDFSGIYDPSSIEAASQAREVDATDWDLQDLTNPDLARQRHDLKKEKIDERAGINRYNFVNQALQGAASGNAGYNLDKAGLDAQIAGLIADANLEGNEKRIKEGWGGMLMNGLFGGAEAAGGLGWSPFGKKA